MNRSPSLLLAALLFALTPGSLLGSGSAASDWSSFRGAAGSGSATTARDRTIVDLRVAWRLEIGSGYSGITPAGDLVVTCGVADERDVLLGLDAATGAARWRVDLGPMTAGRGGSLDGPIATPAVAGGVAYAFSPGGPFAAVEVASGRVLWRRDLAGEDAEVPYYGFASSPVVHHDLVIVQVGGAAGAVVAMERATGDIAWRAGSETVEAQSPILGAVGGRPQLLVATNEWVGGLDPQEGALLWSWPYEAQAAFVLTTSPLALPDGRVFFTPATNRGVMLRPPALERTRAEGEEATAEVLWEANALTRTYSPAALLEDRLVGYTSRFLAAYSTTDGELLWRSREPGDGFLIGVDGRALVITKAGTLHLGDVDDGWRELARAELFDEIVWTPPAYHADLDAVFVRSMTEIARVDLVRDDGPAGAETLRTTERPTRDAATEQPAPAALTDLLAGDPEGIPARIDAFLAGVETPLLREDDGSRALFLWRGEAEDVGISGDFLGVRREAPLQRLAGTDLWWYEVAIDPRLQYAYFLSVDFEGGVDPLNPRTEGSTVYGYDANWTRETVEMSWFAGPDWAGPPAHLAADAGPPEDFGPLARVELDPAEVPEEWRERYAEALGAEVWLPPGYADADRRYPTVYLIEWNGLRDPALGRWGDTLRRAGGTAFEEVIVVLPEAPRLIPNLVAAVDARFRTRADRESRAIIGWTFPGNGVFELVSGSPHLFGRFGVQSYCGFFGSEVDDVLRQMGDAVTAGAELRGYMDWGTADVRSPSEGWDMRASSRRVFEGLRELGVEVAGGEVVDSTDWRSWRRRTHRMLGALFPPTAD